MEPAAESTTRPLDADSSGGGGQEVDSSPAHSRAEPRPSSGGGAGSSAPQSPAQAPVPSVGSGGLSSQGQQQQAKQRRSRTSFSSKQIEILEQHYRERAYLDVSKREDVARQTELSVDRVSVSEVGHPASGLMLESLHLIAQTDQSIIPHSTQIWFSNRRARDRKSSADGGSTTGPQSPASSGASTTPQFEQQPAALYQQQQQPAEPVGPAQSQSLAHKAAALGHLAQLNARGLYQQPASQQEPQPTYGNPSAHQHQQLNQQHHHPAQHSLPHPHHPHNNNNHNHHHHHHHPHQHHHHHAASFHSHYQAAVVSAVGAAPAVQYPGAQTYHGHSHQHHAYQGQPTPLASAAPQDQLF